MADEGLFDVRQLSSVTRQVCDLGKVAIRRGAREEFAAAIYTTYFSLRKHPLEWGDPKFHPKKEGSVVCNGVAPPLLVNYVVFEIERKVVILSVKAFPNSSLDPAWTQVRSVRMVRRSH